MNKYFKAKVLVVLFVSSLGLSNITCSNEYLLQGGLQAATDAGTEVTKGFSSTLSTSCFKDTVLGNGGTFCKNMLSFGYSVLPNSVKFCRHITDELNKEEFAVARGVVGTIVLLGGIYGIYKTAKYIHKHI